MNNKTSISDDSSYPDFCRLAAKNESLFNTFRSNPKYTTILEHVTHNEGNVYLDLVKKKNPDILLNINKYKTNELAGSPNKFHYDIGYLSPTTIRYIKVLTDLIVEFDTLDGLDIVEIGCGYGGQAKIIMDTFNIKSYTLIDLPPVLKLTNKYLDAVNVDMSKIKLLSMDQLSNDNKYDLFISNYAYSECNKKIQLEYFDKVLSKSEKGYMTVNFINKAFDLDYLTLVELKTMIKNVKLIEEEPKTHPNNIILTWK